MTIIDQEFTFNNELIKLVRLDDGMYQVIRDIYYNKELTHSNIPVTMPCNNLKLVREIYEVTLRMI